MKFKNSKYTIRIDSVLLKKFRFIADYHARSGNQEIGLLIKKYVTEFEKKHGEIEDKNK